MPKRIVCVFSLALVLSLAGCGGSTAPAVGGGNGGTSGTGNGSGATASCSNSAPASTMNSSVVVNVPSDLDPTAANVTPTTTIYFTVLMPPRCPGDTFPLVLHSHGYGGSRLTTLAADGTLKPNDPMFQSIDELAQALPYHGYEVISFDERGHGESAPANGGGYARIIDPNAETRDAEAILDYAYDNAGSLQLQTQPGTGIPKDLVVGTLGGSYGGGFQLPLAALDPRIDAIVPVGTWHDLLYSLLPGNSVKLSFDGLLCLLATTGGVQNTPVVQTLCNAVGVQGPLAFGLRSRTDLANYTDGPLASPRQVADSELESFFGSHGMNHFYQQQQAGQFTLPAVPALFIQGNRDNLFNLTEAYWNWRYFKSAGGDARLISTEGGHMNPLANQTEGNADCGSVVGVSAALGWFDHYLKGEDTAAYQAIPKNVCISVADTVGAPDVPAVGVTMSDFPVGALAGAGATPATLPSLTASTTITTINPVFVPVVTISGSGQVLAGVPTVGSLTVSANPAATIQSTNAFVGVGIVRNGQTILVDDQVTAFTEGTHSDNDNVDEDPKILLPAVGEQLQDGDQVGLLFYPQNVQYAAITSAVGLGGSSGIVSYLSGVQIPPITSVLNPVLGLLYVDPYTVDATDIELPIFTPGTYADSRLIQ